MSGSTFELPADFFAQVDELVDAATAAERPQNSVTAKEYAEHRDISEASAYNRLMACIKIGTMTRTKAGATYYYQIVDSPTDTE